MKMLFEFRCTDCNNVHSELTEYKQEAKCPLCGGRANKIFSKPTISLEGITGAFPGAALAWEKRHRPQQSKGE